MVARLAVLQSSKVTGGVYEAIPKVAERFKGWKYIFGDGVKWEMGVWWLRGI